MASRKSNLEHRVSLGNLNPKRLGKMIATIEKHPSVRYILTDKKGKGQFVLMSPLAHKALNSVYERAVTEAFARFEEESIQTSHSKPLPVELL